MNLLVSNARLRGKEGFTNILIEDGTIAAVDENLEKRDVEELDAEGSLVIPGFVDAHIHPDKALLGERMSENRSWSIEEGMAIQNEFKRNYEVDDVHERAVRVVREAVRNGTTSIRAFVDVGTIGGLVPIEALLAARDSLRDVVDIQLVALPQEGLIRDPGAQELVEKALEMGAEVVGGIPGWEYTQEDAREHIDICFELAARYDRPIHMIVDPIDDPHSQSLEYLAIKTLRSDQHRGRVAASWDALAVYTEAYAARVIELVSLARISIVSTPHVQLMFYGRQSPYPKPRGSTRVRQLVGAGVNVALGQDDVNDPYYPFGKPDLLEVAWFMSHMAHLTSVPRELDIVMDMATVNGASAIGLSGYGLEVGCQGDLVVLDAPSVHEALRTRRDRRAVVKRGRIVSRSSERLMSWMD